MSFIADNFNRPNGSLGANWSAAFPWTDVPTTPSTGSIQLLSNAFAPSSSPGNGAYAAWNSGWGVSSFGNNQWAQATISAIAPFTSVVAITACTSSGGTSVYTYTLTSGAALQLNQDIAITGMTHAGNNSATVCFQVSALGSGTFSVLNASPGANESGSSGTGTSPSDSLCGVAVRCTLDGNNCYMIQIGTNSPSVGNNGSPIDTRVYAIELWKWVAGVPTFIAGYEEGVINSIPDVVGDTYTLSAVGTTLTVYKNGQVLIQTTDTSLTSGVPGIIAWSCGGAGEWTTPTVYSTGNSGTQWTNFQGGDYAAANVPYFDDFIASNGTDLHTYNANWVENSGTFATNSALHGVSPSSEVGSNALASWQGATFQNDQWAQVTVTELNSGSSIGPAVRCAVSANTAYFYRGSGSSARVLYRVNAGTFNLLATGTTHVNAVGDVLRLVVIGSTLYCYVNGVLDTFGAITDGTPLTSGFPGIQGVATTISACFQCGNAGISGNVGISGATVALTGASTASTTADANGNYSFPSLVSGSYTITPSASGKIFAPSSLAVTLAIGTLFPAGENSNGSAASSGGSSGLGLLKLLGVN